VLLQHETFLTVQAGSASKVTKASAAANEALCLSQLHFCFPV